MKLHNIVEQQTTYQQIPYLTDRDDIIRYVKNVLRYNDRWKITDEGVEFFDTLYLDNLPNDTLDIKISDAKYINLKNTNIQSLENFPQECSVLNIYDNMFSKLVIKTKSIFETRVVNNYKLKSIITYGNNLNVYDDINKESQRLITNKIEFKNDNVKELEVRNCSKITSFGQFIIPSKTLDRLCVEFCNIRSFKDFDFVVKNICDLTLPYLDNYRYIDKIKSNKLFLHVFENTDSIITLMNNNSKRITLFYVDTPDKISEILDKFITMENRSEHIMDCAIELIDAGFEKAAEL